MTLNCYSFVYYSYKSLFLLNVLKCTLEMNILKSINTLTLACKKEHLLKEDLLVASSYRKAPVLESLFNSEYCEIFQSTYFEEHLHSAASDNVFMKLRNFKFISFNFTLKNRFFQHQYQKQVKMFVFTS